MVYTGLHYRCDGCGEVYSFPDFDCPCGGDDFKVCEIEAYRCMSEKQRAEISGKLSQAWAYLSKSRGWPVADNCGLSDFELANSGEELVSRAFSGFYKLALVGCPEAMDALARMYRDGEGCVKDSAKSLWLFISAAHDGLASAGYAAGIMYKDGDGVPKNPTKAFKWLSWTASGDYGMLSLALAECYFDGIGCNQNFDEGVRLARKFAESCDCDDDCQLYDYCGAMCALAVRFALNSDRADSVTGAVLAITEMALKIKKSSVESETVSGLISDVVSPAISEILRAEGFLERLETDSTLLLNMEPDFCASVEDAAVYKLMVGAFRWEELLILMIDPK